MPGGRPKRGSLQDLVNTQAEDLARHAFANDPSLTISAIAEQVNDLLAEHFDEYEISEKTIERAIKPLRSAENSEIKASYQIYKWPESHESGVLPWEAAAVALEIVRNRRDRNRTAPSVAQIRWAYRLSLAAPDMPVVVAKDFALDTVERLSEVLAVADISPTGLVYRSSVAPEERATPTEMVWDMLSYAPWRSVAHLQDYQDNSTVRKRGAIAYILIGDNRISADALRIFGIDPKADPQPGAYITSLDADIISHTVDPDPNATIRSVTVLGVKDDSRRLKDAPQFKRGSDDQT